MPHHDPSPRQQFRPRSHYRACAKSPAGALQSRGSSGCLLRSHACSSPAAGKKRIIRAAFHNASDRGSTLPGTVDCPPDFGSVFQKQSHFISVSSEKYFFNVYGDSMKERPDASLRTPPPPQKQVPPKFSNPVFCLLRALIARRCQQFFYNTGPEFSRNLPVPLPIEANKRMLPELRGTAGLCFRGGRITGLSQDSYTFH